VDHDGGLMATEAARRWIMTVVTPMSRTSDFDWEAAVALLGEISGGSRVLT
jgi:hypothetical protein